MKRLPLTTVFATCLWLSLTAGLAGADIWHVPTDAPTIAAALDLAEYGDVVELACGTYFEHDLILKAGVVVRSEDGVADCATIDAAYQGRVFIAEDLEQPAVLLGLTITCGVVPDDEDFGGGIYCQDASLNMAQCEVRNCRSDYAGGGLSAQRGTLIISSTVFADNVGLNGGGGAARLANIDGEFLDCRFEDNIGIDGAAIYMSFSNPSLTFCTFANNEGDFFGGAVFCVSDSEPVFNHCTMVGNSAHLGGGIMVAADSHPTIEDCIIAFNNVGAGIDVHDEYSTVSVICSDVYGNEDGGYTGHIEDQTGLNGNIAEDPMFCDLESGDLSLADISPCLGQNNECNVLMGAHVQGCVTTAVAESVPTAFRLAPNRPNPFNPSTTIVFELNASMAIELDVFDLTGRRVSSLQRCQCEAGRHEVTWRGCDDLGRAQPSGTYVCRLRAGDRVETNTMVLVR